MKKRIDREELIELRKKELARKDLENQVGRDLKYSYEKIESLENLRKNKSPYVIHALNFCGTLIIFYVPYTAFSLFVDFGQFSWVMQLAFWLMAFWSLIAKQTIFDYLLKNHR